MFEPNIDAYGTYARWSALADALELEALLGRSRSEADLGDYIADMGWTRRPVEHYHIPTLAPPDVDEAEEADVGVLIGGALAKSVARGRERAREVFGVLRERADLLEEAYPFRIVDQRLTPRDDLEPAASPYVGILSLTLAHAYNLDVPVNPRDAFEDVVVDALRKRGLIAANMGMAGRGGATFEEALGVAGPAVLLGSHPDAAIRARRAQDGGVDIIAHAPFRPRDRRPGRWAYIGQVTCAQSDYWEGKAKEPVPGRWRSFLGLYVLPQAFLAVPHHIPGEVLANLAEATEGRCLFLDRIRMTELTDGRTDDLATIARAVLRTELEG